MGRRRGPAADGAQVYPNELLIVLPDTSEMVASVQVHESLAGDVKPGMAATVKVDAVGGEIFQGTVDSIGVLAESGAHATRIAASTRSRSRSTAWRR